MILTPLCMDIIDLQRWSGRERCLIHVGFGRVAGGAVLVRRVLIVSLPVLHEVCRVMFSGGRRTGEGRRDGRGVHMSASSADAVAPAGVLNSAASATSGPSLLRRPVSSASSPRNTLAAEALWSGGEGGGGDGACSVPQYKFFRTSG
jgi:hypothetical protein